MAVTTNNSVEDCVQDEIKEKELVPDEDEIITIQNRSDIVEIQINSKSKQFECNDLQHLSYFEARLSDRWKQDDSDNKESISESTESSTNQMINIGDTMGFSIEVFEALINFNKTNKIDTNLLIEDLQSLLECQSYFLTNIINETSIRQYFEDKPDLELNKLRSYLETRTVVNDTDASSMIDTLIKEYIENIDKMIQEYRRNTLVKQCQSRHRGEIILKSLILDEHTVVDTLISLLKLEWSDTSYSRDPSCRIPQFDKDLFDKLWSQCKDYVVSNERLYQHIFDITQTILKDDKIGKRFRIKDDEKRFINTILSQMKSLLFSKLNKHHIKDRVLFSIAHIVLTIMCGSWHWKSFESHEAFMKKHFSKEEVYQMLTALLKYHESYMEKINAFDNETEEHTQSNEKCRAIWKDYIIVCLKNCQVCDMIEIIETNKEKLISLMIRNDNFDWIIDKARNNVGFKQQCRLAFCLTNYIFSRAVKPTDLTTHKFLKFIEVTTGLQWNQQ